MKHPYKILLFCLFCVAFIGCDRATKSIAKLRLENKAPLSYFHNTVRLQYVENTGAFLSLGADWPAALSFWVLSILPMLFLIAITVYFLKKYHNKRFVKLLPVMLIFSGGAGNIIDRMLYNRHVSDFINLGINNLRTGIFNLADVYVTAGALLLLIASSRKEERIRHSNAS
jgi:signal peptidase II